MYNGARRFGELFIEAFELKLNLLKSIFFLPKLSKFLRLPKPTTRPDLKSNILALMSSEISIRYSLLQLFPQSLPASPPCTNGINAASHRRNMWRILERNKDMFSLAGKKALITGASGGLGSAIARAFHAQGAIVTLSGTRREALDALAAELKDRVHIVTADLSDSASTEALVPSAEAAMGGLDILVNNAGLTKDNLFMRLKDEDWDRVIAVNLTAAFRLSRAAVKGMMKRRSGRIITITSIVGVTGNPGQGNYAASKAGLIGMSKALAGEVASRGITINCIAPGFIESPMTDALNEKQKEGILGNVPAGRLGKGTDIAAAAVFLASDEAGYVTGATLHVNGGMAMI
jgi:3-oxoacyl-[acyl-carrier protein] reductase